MSSKYLAVLLACTAALAGCDTYNDREVEAAPPPPLPPGAIAGTMAADRDGDGRIDGYYRDGAYYPFEVPPPPPCPTPPPPPSSGERG